MPTTSQKILLCNAQLLDTDKACFTPGEILIADGRILAVGAPDTLPREDVQILDACGAPVTPGLVDIHTHGRAGGDFISADVDLLCRMSRSYITSGVTTVMPTLASAPIEEFSAAAARIHTAAKQTNGARLLGIHLEGRYLNEKKRGAHAAHLLAPLHADELVTLYAALTKDATEPMPVRVSAAMELDQSGEFIKTAHRLGIALSLAHTQATYDQATELIARGVNCFTHLYNAMPPLHHRDGGAVAACLDSNAYGEIICDGFHIAPHMVRLSYRLLGHKRMVLVSDSMEGTACPDGNYTIAGMDVIVKDGKAYTTDGAIAGSTIGLFEAVCNLKKFCDIPLAQALCCATVNPARAARIDHLVGTFKVGAYADFCVLREDGDTVSLLATYVGGVIQGGEALHA